MERNALWIVSNGYQSNCFASFLAHFTGSEIGLALSQALNLLFVVQFGIKEASEMINQMTGVERILEYTKIKSEGPFDTPEG